MNLNKDVILIAKINHRGHASIITIFRAWSIIIAVFMFFMAIIIAIIDIIRYITRRCISKLNPQFITKARASKENYWHYKPLSNREYNLDIAMRLLKLLIITTLCLMPASLLAGQADIQLTSNEFQKLADTYLYQYRDREHISAVTLTANSKKNSITIYSGYTDFFNTSPVNPSKLYQIGSITKSFIAAIILQLEATKELRFSIDDKLSTYLPQYPEWGNVTIRQLLNMTSGIPDYLSNDTYLRDLSNNPNKEWLPEEEVSYVAKNPLLFPPGTKWDYSNTNYILAGLIIVKLTGHSLEEEINKRFLPKNNASQLNLKNTFYISHQYPSSITSRIVHGYRFGGNIGKFIPPQTDITNFSLSYAGAAGAMVSNTEDITRWVQAVLTPDRVLPAKQLEELVTLVSTATGKPLKTPNAGDPNGFGLGIGLSYAGSDFPGLIFNYEGMTMGYRALYIYIPNENLIISVTTNSSTDSDNDHLMELIGDIYTQLQT